MPLLYQKYGKNKISPAPANKMSKNNPTSSTFTLLYITLDWE
jgi:hypothetical protein